jgi:hypothetical protein
LDDFEHTDYEEQSADDRREDEVPEGPALPMGLTTQTAATGLLVIVLAAALWLIFGPQPALEPAPGLPTATALAGGTPTDPATGEAPAVGRGTPSSRAPSVPAPTAESTTARRTAAPSGIADGGFVRVSGTEGLDLRFRYGPGTEYVTIRIAEEGDLMRVTGGPEQADGVRWWRLQDELGNVGWAAEGFLAPVAAPAGWNPPSASPTFETGSIGPAATGASP